MKQEIVHNVSRLELSINSPRKNKVLDALEVLGFVENVLEDTERLDISKVGKNKLAQFFLKSLYKTKIVTLTN